MISCLNISGVLGKIYSTREFLSRGNSEYSVQPMRVNLHWNEEELNQRNGKIFFQWCWQKRKALEDFVVCYFNHYLSSQSSAEL